MLDLCITNIILVFCLWYLPTHILSKEVFFSVLLQLGSNRGTTNPFIGRLSKVSLFSSKLNDSSVTAIYKQRSSRRTRALQVSQVCWTLIIWLTCHQLLTEAYNNCICQSRFVTACWCFQITPGLFLRVWISFNAVYAYDKLLEEVQRKEHVICRI